ncbi:MAG: ATP-binding protein [Lachnospiraceae bacterium]|nr:ATP-binding protein [Lachnospiraceae bacterium]
MEEVKKVPRRIAQTLISSLKGGVVPRIGLPYITVGRRREVEALLKDIEMIEEGGASFRFIVGKYGAGKSFLLQSIRNYAMDRNMVVVDADLSPERRLQGSGGQGLATYRELIGNLSVRTKPEGGALTIVLDRWIQSVQSEVAATEGISPDDPAFAKRTEQRIYSVIRSMNDMVHGFDFARVISLYYKAYVNDDDDMRAKAVRWLRGEYSTKSEAKADLGVTSYISDDDWYEYLKLFAGFFRKAGYRGMLVFIDELVNIYKVPNSITRQYNYEKILTMYNDAMQGKAHFIGTVMCGTPQAIEDTRRGVYSYEALRSRLSEGKFAQSGVQDLLAPVIRLEPLTAEEMLVLTEKLAKIHAGLYGYEEILTENDLADFIRIEYGRIGADTSITPREVIRDFIELLDIIYQNPGMRPADLLGSDRFSYARPDTGDTSDIPEDNMFAEFKL